MSQNTIWYVYTGGDELANKTVSRIISAENICYRMPCADGKKRTLWKCDDHLIVTAFENARDSSGLKIQVFEQRGLHGKIRLSFIRKKRQKVICRRKPLVTNGHHRE